MIYLNDKNKLEIIFCPQKSEIYEFHFDISIICFMFNKPCARLLDAIEMIFTATTKFFVIIYVAI